MNKIKKLFVVSLFLPTLFGCSSAKIHKINFKSFGTPVTLDFFNAKFSARLMETESYLTNLRPNKAKSFQIVFNSQLEDTRLSNPDKSFYTTYQEISGKILYDSTNQRFRSDTLLKTYIHNHLNEKSDLFNEGPSYSRTRLYGETLDNRNYVYDLDFKTVSINSYDLLKSAIPSHVESLLSYNNYYAYASTTTYIKNDNVFTIVYKTSNYHNTLDDFTIQFIFNGGLQMLCKRDYQAENTQYKTTFTEYADITLKALNTGVSKINYYNHLQNQ